VLGLAEPGHALILSCDDWIIKVNNLKNHRIYRKHVGHNRYILFFSTISV
jgi:hypothetical protein